MTKQFPEHTFYLKLLLTLIQNDARQIQCYRLSSVFTGFAKSLYNAVDGMQKIPFK